MIQISSIPYLVAKAHANHAKSPTFQQIQNMVSAQKLLDVESILASTGYSPILDEVRPSVNLADFELALRREYARLLHIYQVGAQGDVAKLLEAYVTKIDAENLDLILQAIIRGNVDDDLEKIIIPVGKFGMRHYRRIMENTDVNAATDFIVYPRLRKVTQNALAQSSDPDEQVFLLSSALSHTSFSIIAETAPAWVKLEVEFLNLETICRAIKLDLNPEPWLIPNIGVVYRQRSVLSNMGSPEEVMTSMLPTFPVSKVLQMALATDNPVVTLEDEALKYLYLRRYRDFILYGNRREAILDYFSIKRAEIEDIGRILLAKIKHVPADQVRPMLYPIYRRN